MILIVLDIFEKEKWLKSFYKQGMNVMKSVRLVLNWSTIN